MWSFFVYFWHWWGCSKAVWSNFQVPHGHSALLCSLCDLWSLNSPLRCLLAEIPKSCPGTQGKLSRVLLCMGCCYVQPQIYCQKQNFSQPCSRETDLYCLKAAASMVAGTSTEHCPCVSDVCNVISSNQEVIITCGWQCRGIRGTCTLWPC